jgi:hypothetical protein
MDIGRLALDWHTESTLRECGDDNVVELAKRLAKIHAYLMGPRSGAFGYLYQRQAQLIKQQKEELERCKTQTQGK